MSDFARDLRSMHNKFEFHQAVAEMDPRALARLLVFRMDFLEEEFDEIAKAIAAENIDEIVDGLIDMCVVAIGTLDLFKVDVNEAWKRVHRANMSKSRGVNPTRPNPTGLPDLVKPDDFVSPNHVDNTGLLGAIDFREVERLINCCDDIPF